MVSGDVCDLCSETAGEPVLQVTLPAILPPQSFSLLRCSGCGLVTTTPRLKREELEAYYSREYWGEAPADDQHWVRRDQAPRTVFLERFRRQGRILDVGCGLGLFLLALDPARWERYGLEVMPAAYQEAVRRLGAGHVLQEEITSAGFPPQHFDVVTFWDALEHLPNPLAALQEAFRLLRPGGLALLRLPNFASYLARRFGEDWYELAVPYHLYHFTPATLTQRLAAAGFRVRIMEDSLGPQRYHALKHSVLNRLTRQHGPRGGRWRYYLLKPFFHPWERLSSRWGGASSLQVCAERPLAVGENSPLPLGGEGGAQRRVRGFPNNLP